MEKRVVIAVVLSIAVLYVYSMLVPAPAKKPEEQKQTVTQAVMQQETSAKPVKPLQLPSVPPVAAAAKDVTVETDLYTAVFSTQGGALRKLVLKKYRDAAGPSGKEVALISEDSAANYTVRSESAGFALDPNAVYSVSSEGFRVGKGEKKELEFTYTTLQGVVLRKTFVIDGDGYGIQLKEQIANGGAATSEGVMQLVLNNRVDAKADENRYETYGPVAFSENKLITEKLKDLEKGPRQYDKGVQWAGFADKYFIRVALAEKNDIASVKLTSTPAKRSEEIISSPAIALKPGEAATLSYRLYFGPKDLDILKAQGNRLEEVIDFGWFSALAKPLLYTLKFFYSYVRNYGFAIIIITVILKILFFPLTHKSYKSMKEMQKLQPKMTELKEKYKNDRDGLNRAVMELYKTHKVNPLGGCLPMVVQIPVFFALYKALMYSIELRHAPFMFWIHDLSAKDPYYVTPIIMGVTMFIQQKMTPSQMDPVQQKMMLALPVVFTFMFLNFPSGLVLYWLVNNILTIAQQAYINKSLQS